MNLDDVTAALNISAAKLGWLATVPYLRKEVEQHGATRVVWVPPHELRFAQRALLALLRDHLRIHRAATGFIKGGGTITNAYRHLRPGDVAPRLLLQADIEHFYEAIDGQQVAGALAAAGCTPSAAQAIAAVCTRHDAGRRVLVQGAATSPALANAVCFDLDEILERAAGPLGVYTRYADDITMSWQDDVPRLPLDSLRILLRRFGFALHEGKSRLVHAGEAMVITGIVINHAPGRPVVRAPRAQWRRLRVGCHRWRVQPDEVLRLRLQGLAAFLHQTDPQRAQKYMNVLQGSKTEGGQDANG